jgi:hypothetical protein
MDAKNRNVTPKASPEPRRRPPAAGKGRPRGAKNKKSQAQKLAEARERTLKLELEGDVSEFFQKLTVKSYTWRENMRRKMEDPKHGTDPRMVDQCLKYALGTPRKQQPIETGKRSLVFISEGGLPWDPALDPMREQERAAIAAQQAQEKMEAAAAERKRQGLEPDPDDDEDPDAPELVR